MRILRHLLQEDNCLTLKGDASHLYQGHLKSLVSNTRSRPTLQYVWKIDRLLASHILMEVCGYRLTLIPQSAKGKWREMRSPRKANGGK